MPQVGLETTIPVFKRAKTVHALDLSAAVIGTASICCSNLTVLLYKVYTLKKEYKLEDIRQYLNLRRMR
jgi:hypothetical protein